MPATLALKTKWTADDIKSRLPANGGVGFVFHATDWETIGFAYESADYTEDALWEQPPFIGSPIFFRNRVVGAHVISPQPPALWADGHAGIRRFRSQAYEPSLRLAHEAGLTHVGLGALVPFATDYGRYARNGHIRSLTTGHAATVAAIRQQVESIGQLLAFAPAQRSYAIFGAVGSIGANVARWFAQTGAASIVLVDTPARGTQLASLAEELRQSFAGLQVAVCDSDHIRSLARFDIGIVATSTSRPWLDADVLARAPIWIDDSHPRAASTEAEAAVAQSVLYLECFLRGPQGLCQSFPFRLPTSRDCYSCFAEVFVCWQLGMDRDFVVGPATLDQISFMDAQLRSHGFAPGPLTSKSGAEIPHATISQMRGIFERESHTNAG